MGATPSVQRDAKSPEDAPQDISAELSDAQDGEIVDGKPLQKNGQISISSLNGKADDQTEYNGHTEENPPAEVGQTDTMSQKEDSPETIEVHQEEVAPQVNGEKGDDSANADEITTVEEKAVEEKQEEANEVGFKKIFRFVGFKFTLKKDKNEKTEPVQLLTVKEAESGTDAVVEEKNEEPAKEEDKSVEEKSPETTEKEAITEEVTDKTEEPVDQTVTDAPTETEKASDEETEKSAEETGTVSEKEPEPAEPTESPTSPPSQETQSPFKRFFTQGIFSNLRKKASFKKPKDEEQVKEKSAEEDIKETEESEEGIVEGKEEAEVDAEKEPVEGEQPEKPSETIETKAETAAETTSTETEVAQDLKVEAETTSEAETVTQTETDAAPTPEAPAAEDPTSETAEAQPIDDAKPTSDKPDVSEEVTTEAEIVSSQEKSKAQGSPLKKLFTGAGLKKLSSKKQKSKKEADSKQTESSEPVAENIQSSTESAEPQKPDSDASSPDESGEHPIGEVTQAEVAQVMEPEGEPVTSDSEKKKEGILPWSSFKKLVTPKKRVKRPSESEDEAPGDKPKSSTLSSTESAVSDEKTDEPKPSEEVPSESKEESQVESKAEPKAEKPEPVVDEPKRKMDTSVSWEALICVGSSKKRARKTSDSDDEEPKIEEEAQQSGEEQTKTADSPLVSSGEADHENLASSPEPEEELVSTWESFKRLVTHRKKPKGEDKSDEASGPEQTTSDSETPKEESSFSLRKLIPRRKKKSDGKQEQVSSDVGSAEDESDTPAVVPLSEYDNEPSAEVAVNAEEVKQESAPATQAKASAEDRSPSWISTTVENAEDETEGKQLSDIPEEGDTAATPKSTDNTIAEDIVELTSEAVTALEQVEETEMVSAVSRVTASPVTSGETTPVPGDSVEKKADAILQEAVETISVTTSVMAVTMTKEQEKVVAVTTDALVVESAIKEEKTVLVAHEKTEATAVCTGLDTCKIKAVEEESLSQKPSVESVTVVSQALVTELPVEEKTQEPEKASVTEVEVHEVQISEVQTELKDEPLENAVEEKPQFEEMKETPEPEKVTDLQEVAAVKVAVINAVQQEPEFLEEPLVAEKSQIEAAGPVEAAVEESICSQTVEVTEVPVAEGEAVQKLEDVKEEVATVELASVEGVAMAVTQEVMAALPEEPASQTVESTEDPIPVVATTEEFAVIKETVCVVSSTSETTESHSTDLAYETVFEKVPLILSTGDHKIQVMVNDVEVVSAQGVVEGNIEAASTKVSVAVEEVETVKEETEIIQASQVTEAEIIEKQSSVIVQEIIQNVVENLAEAHAEQVSEKVSEKTTEDIDSCTTAVDVKLEEVPAVSEMTEEKPSTEDISEESAPVETSSEKPKASDDICKENDEQTRIVTEKPTKPVNEAILITETVLVSVTDEIQAQSEEVATVAVADVHQETEVTKSEVELKQAEEKSETTESEEGKSQVESDPKDVQTEIQGKTQVSDTIPEEKAETETSQDQVVAEHCQMAQEVQIETAQEFNVGVVNVINADDVPIQDTETNMKDDSSEVQESVEDRSQKDLEEPQTKVSTQDTNQGESRDSDCQKTDAKNAKVETAIEKTANAFAVEEVVEEVGNEIEPISTEVVTVS